MTPQPPVPDTDTPAALHGARLPRWLLPADWPTHEGRPALARLELADGRIARVRPLPAAEGPAGQARWDLHGAPVLPGFVEAHAHLDKAFIGPRLGAVRPGLLGAIEAVIADRERWTREDLRSRMRRGLHWAWQAGTTRLRTHIDWWDPQATPLAWEVMGELAHEWRDRLAIERVALVKLGPCEDRAVAQALARRIAGDGPGALLGGFVHSSQWNPGALRELLRAAQDEGLDLDLHVDEELNPEAEGLAWLARNLRATRFDGRVVCGHTCALAAQPESRALATLDAVARAPITLVSLPITNLLLQDAATGRTPRQRGLTLVKEARARGIPLLIGSDNVQDPFCRVGSLDPVEAMQAAVLAGQLDGAFDHWSMALCRADWLGREAAAAAPGLEGRPADLVVFDRAEATAWPSRAARRRVLRGGRAIDTDTSTVTDDSGAPAR